MCHTTPGLAGCVAAVLVAVAFGAGCESVGAGPPCAAEAEYPVCAASGAGVVTCRDGEELVVPCAVAGEVCVDLVDAASGARLSECLPAGSAACDPQTFLPSCPDDATVIACVAPATRPTIGHTERLPCAEGETCRADRERGACQPPRPPGWCDAETHPGACGDAQTPVVCLADQLVALPPCTPPTVCLVGPEGPVCGPEPTCDPQTSAPRCADEETRVVCDALGQEVSQACWRYSTCRTGPNGGFCIPDSAEPCDPATFVPTCDGTSLVRCSALTGYTLSDGCGGWSRCALDADTGRPTCIGWGPPRRGDR